MARQNWKDAVTWFGDVVRVAPHYEPVRTRHNLALSLISLKRHNEASAVFEAAAEFPSSQHYEQFYFDAIGNEITRGHYFHAARWGEAGTQRYPQDAWLWDKFAWALKMSRDRERAAAAYERAESLVYPDTTPKHKTVLSLPFRGEWRVMQGNGNDASHRGLGARFAWDFEATAKNGRTRTGPGRDNADYSSFGQEVLAPADGRIIALENTVPDNEPFHRDASPNSGNYVLIEHEAGEFSSLGHLQQGSIVVKVGETVKRGQLLARVGNSGRATLPHLHYSFIGLHAGKRISIPAQFSHYLARRDGNLQPIEIGVPEQNQFVQNKIVDAQN